MALRPLQKAFLAAYRECGIVRQAAETAKIHRGSHYDWMDEPEYAEAVAVAREESIEKLEEAARHDATIGVEEPVIYQGQLCYEPELDSKGRPKRDENGHIQLSNRVLKVAKVDHGLKMFLLKSLRPEKYRENFTATVKAEVTHRFEGSMADLIATYRQLTSE